MSSKKGFAFSFILGAVVGAIVLFAFVFQPNILENDLIAARAEREVNYLESENSQLIESINKLREDYDSLQNEYSSESIELADLQWKYDDIENKYESNYNDWVSLSEDVMEFYEYLNSYTNLEDSFQRVLNSEELSKIKEKIEEVTRMEQNVWDACWNIHKYVRDEIKYAYDEEIPVITTYRYYPDAGDTQLTSFETGLRENYHQSLEYTVKYRQGDCDDQAMLEYAMIKYYEKYIHGEQYRLYLARISFYDDNSHLAVFMPVADGQICILDPAGQYQTGTWNSIKGKTVSSELNNYNEHWDANQGIMEITLFNVDIDSGEYTEDFKGSLSETIQFLGTP